MYPDGDEDDSSGFCRMVTTQGAGSGGKLCDKDNKSWAASVSSTVRSLDDDDDDDDDVVDFWMLVYAVTAALLLFVDEVFADGA